MQGENEVIYLAHITMLEWKTILIFHNLCREFPINLFALNESWESIFKFLPVFNLWRFCNPTVTADQNIKWFLDTLNICWNVYWSVRISIRRNVKWFAQKNFFFSLSRNENVQQVIHDFFGFRKIRKFVPNVLECGERLVLGSKLILST